MWRGLPETYGKWYTIYKRMNRWSKNGVLTRVLQGLAKEGIINLEVETYSLDSTIHRHPERELTESSVLGV